MNKAFVLLGGIGVGAGLMYVFDPDRGGRRRALMRDKVESAANQATDYAERMSRDIPCSLRSAKGRRRKGHRNSEW